MFTEQRSSHPGRNEKFWAANNARVAMIQEIVGAGNFTPETALHLSVDYAAYELESLLHTTDGGSDLIETGHPNMRFGQVLADHEAAGNERLRIESALFAVQHGDYSQLKSFIGQKGKDLVAYGKWLKKYLKQQGCSDTTDKWHSIEMGEQMKIMAGLLPDSGDPVRLPLPAWMDEQYLGVSE